MECGVPGTRILTTCGFRPTPALFRFDPEAPMAPVVHVFTVAPMPQCTSRGSTWNPAFPVDPVALKIPVAPMSPGGSCGSFGSCGHITPTFSAICVIHTPMPNTWNPMAPVALEALVAFWRRRI